MNSLASRLVSVLRPLGRPMGLQMRGLSVSQQVSGVSSDAGAAHQRVLTWGVVRTANGRLPVYRDIRNHNTRELTVIRKVVGNLEGLRSSITQEFDVQLNDVWVKVGRVEVKGMHVKEITKWLMNKGF